MQWFSKHLGERSVRKLPMAGSADNTQPCWQIPEVGQILHPSQVMQWQVCDTIYEYYQLKTVSQRSENRLYMVAIPLDHEMCALCFMSLDTFPCLLVYSIRELEQNLDPTVVWNYKNLNYVELVHGAFQVYNILLLFCIFIVIFWVLYRDFY